MSKKVEMETKVATATGFHGGQRLRRGDTFTAPTTLKGRWFKPANSTDERVEAALHENSVIDTMKATEVKTWAASATSEEINQAISVEQGSKARKAVLAILRDELANRVGQTGGPDPAAKDPNEKDPLVGAGGAADEVFE